MKFRLLKTPNLKSAMSTVFDEIKNTSGSICLIVPDKLTVTAEKQLFEYLNIESCFDINITTLTRLSQKILADIGVEYTPISKIGSIVLLKKILNERKSDLKLFSSPSFSYNYTDLLFRTITQFKASNITPDEMIVDEKKPTPLQDKIHDLKIVYQEYENGKAGLVDPTDRLTIFAREIKSSEYIKNTTFFFLGFDDFTNQGYTLIEQLIRHAQGVNVAVYGSKQGNKNIYPNEMFDRLVSLCYNQGLPLDIQEADTTLDTLHQNLSDNIFSFNTNILETDQIKIKNFKNIEQEIEYVARDIRQNILSGKHFYEFGVAVFDLETHKTKIKNAFEKYDINYYLDSSAKLSSTFYFNFFLNYLKLFSNNFKKENIIEFVNSPFVSFPSTTKTKFVNFLQEISFSGSLEKLKVEDDLIELKNYLLTIFNSFPIKKTDRIEDIEITLNGLKQGLDIDNQLNKIVDSTTSLYDKKILVQSPSQFESLLGEIKKFYLDAPLDEIVDILESSANDQKIMPIPMSLDCVQLLDASEVMTDFEHLYFVNVNNSTAPSIIQDIGIILDKDIANLDFKNKLSPTINHLNKLAKFKLFNSILMFNQNLTITSSIFNDSEASPLVASIQNIAKNNISENVNSQSHKILSKWDLIEFLSSSCDQQFDNLLDVYGVKKFYPIKYLPKDLAKKLNFEEISCSALENYFKCPMMFFLNHTLKIKQEREQGIAKVDVGNMLHQLAEDYFRAKGMVDIPQFVTIQIAKYMECDPKLVNFISTPIYFNLLKEGARFLFHLKYLNENSQFRQAFAEYNFGLKSNKTIPLADNVYLKGKIDRVDFFGDFVRIIDYKTGNADASLDELYYGKKLQLFLYGRLAEKIFGKKLAGSFYLPIKNSIVSDEKIKQYKLNGFYVANNDLILAWDKRLETMNNTDLMSLSLNKDRLIRVDARSTKVLNPNDFENLLNYSLKVANQAIQEIKSGYVATSPMKFSEQSTSCDYCPYLAICRKNSCNIAMRNKKDVNLSSFGGNNE